MKKRNDIVYVGIERIVADEEQARKEFDLKELAKLSRTLQADGVMEPLKVSELPNGKYLLMDGERRYRAAKMAKMDEVPVIVMTFASEADRLVKQYQIQASKVDWNPSERAYAFARLKKELGVTARELAAKLGIGESQVDRFMAFDALTNKEYARENHLPLEAATYIRVLIARTTKAYQEAFNEVFNDEKKQAFEKAIIDMVLDGKMENRRQYPKIADAITAQPKLIKELLAGKKYTPDEMFIKSQAKAAYHARNIETISNNLCGHLNEYLANPNVHMSVTTASAMKNLKKKIDEAIKLHEQRDI